MEKILEGQVAIITAAGHGMGRAAALTFAQAGATVVAADRRPAEADATVASIVDEGGRAVAIGFDATKDESVAKLVDLTMNDLGRIDILWNLVGGIGWTPEGTRPDVNTTEASYDILDVDPEYWDWQLRLNLTSVYLCCRHVLPHMIAAGRGSIISTATGAAADVHESGDGFHPYVVAKAGVVVLSRLIAQRYGRFGIRSNVIAPGIVDSWWTEAIEKRAIEGTLLGRIGSVEDVANVGLFLASDAASYVTGEEIRLDGGARLRSRFS